MQQKRVSCVICAYNESERIADVLSVAVDHPMVSETIVVDDGSTDGTSTVVKRFPSAKLLVQNPNQGKSRAFARGIGAASGELIMILDADLRNLTRENITALIEPVLSGSADTSMSLRGNSLLVCRFIGLDYLSGERVMPREMVTRYVDTIASLTPYGIESFLNKRIIEEGLRVAIIRFDNVINLTKRAKIGWWKGIYAQWKMVLDILRVISLFEVVRQNYLLLELARKNK